jgi:hypothetical protein
VAVAVRGNGTRDERAETISLKFNRLFAETGCSYTQPRHFGHFASQELIIVWLQVRVLPGPPRSPAQTEISQFNANRPELAAICARILSLQSTDWIAGTVLRSLSLPWKIAFTDGGSWPW